MPLLDRNHFPPGGFTYREPSINWSAPRQGLPFAMVAAQIQAVRIANPNAGLDPSMTACETALDVYTCTRLKDSPEWCVVPTDPVARVKAAAAKAAVPCPSCGHRARK